MQKLEGKSEDKRKLKLEKSASIEDILLEVTLESAGAS